MRSSEPSCSPGSAGYARERESLLEQARESAREYLTRESHYLWGRRYLLDVRELDDRPQVTVELKRLVLAVRPGSDRATRDRLLHEMLPPILARWQENLGVIAMA